MPVFYVSIKSAGYTAGSEDAVPTADSGASPTAASTHAKWWALMESLWHMLPLKLIMLKLVVVELFDKSSCTNQDPYREGSSIRNLSNPEIITIWDK